MYHHCVYAVSSEKARAANYENNKNKAMKRGKSVPAYDFLERDYK